MPVETPSITFVLPGVECGGSEHVVAMLANAFTQYGCNVSLVAFAPSGTNPFYALNPDVDFRAIGLPPKTNAGPRLLYAVRRALRLRRTLKEIRPDLVISFLTRTNILALLAKPDCPVIISERNNAQRQTVGRSWGFLRRILYPRAAALVTMTDGAMKQFDDFAPAIQRVIPNHAKLGRDGGSARDGTSLVAVGRLVPQKGFDLLLEAFAKVAAAHPDWVLTIWGEGAERQSLERQRDALGLNSAVRLPGVTATPGAWTENADIFVLSSRYEGWGLVVGEAMSAGVPTVAFDCQFGPSEMIRHNETGLLVAPEDVAALAESLDRMMSDIDLRKRLAAAGRNAMRRFDPEKVTGLWVDLVRQLIPLPPPANECRDAA